jgi:hypothetical protein
VGHSLGAGTTALLVALIKNGLYERAMHQQHQAQQGRSAASVVTVMPLRLPWCHFVLMFLIGCPSQVPSVSRRLEPVVHPLRIQWSFGHVRSDVESTGVSQLAIALACCKGVWIRHTALRGRGKVVIVMC